MQMIAAAIDKILNMLHYFVEARVIAANRTA